MQNKIKIFQLVLFIPVLFWLVAKPISLHSANRDQIKIENKSHSKHSPNQKQSVIYAEQHVYQTAANLQLDFPSDWAFLSPSKIFSIRSFENFKLPTSVYRVQFMRILLTQFIATLAP